MEGGSHSVGLVRRRENKKSNGQWYLETTTHDVHGEESGGRTKTEQPVQTLIVFPVSADLKSNGMHFLRVHPRLY